VIENVFFQNSGHPVQQFFHGSGPLPAGQRDPRSPLGNGRDLPAARNSAAPANPGEPRTRRAFGEASRAAAQQKDSPSSPNGRSANTASAPRARAPGPFRPPRLSDGKVLQARRPAPLNEFLHRAGTVG